MNFLRLDLKYIVILLGSLIAGYLVHLTWLEILEHIKIIFLWPKLNYFLGGFSAIVTLIYKIKFRKLTISPKMSFNDFKVPIEDLLSFLSNPLTVVCALSLAKGLFLQSIGEHTYFNDFSSIELGFISVVTTYLLYSSIMELVNHIMAVALKTEVITAAKEPNQYMV